MKDFDVERLKNGKDPETFTIGGEKFTLRDYVPAESLALFSRTEVNGFADTLKVYDEFVKAVVIEKDYPKWEKVRQEADPPLTLWAVEQVVFWAMGVAAGRPTEASSSSRRGRTAPAAT